MTAPELAPATARIVTVGRKTSVPMVNWLETQDGGVNPLHVVCVHVFTPEEGKDAPWAVGCHTIDGNAHVLSLHADEAEAKDALALILRGKP